MLNGINRLFAKKGNELRIEKSNLETMGIFAKTKIDQGKNLGLAFEKINDTGDPSMDYRKTKLGRYINHSPNPNIKIVKEDNKFYFINIKTLKPGDELLVDFQSSTLSLDQQDDYDIYLVENTESVKNMIDWIREHENKETIKRLNLERGIHLKDYRVIGKGYRRVGLVGVTDFITKSDVVGNPSNRKGAYMTVYIKPNNRGNNYGIQALKILADELVIDDIYVRVDKENKPALQMYSNDKDFVRVHPELRSRLIKLDIITEDEEFFYYSITGESDDLFSETANYISEAPEDEEEGGEETPDDDAVQGEETDDTQTEDDEFGWGEEEDVNIEMEEPEDEKKRDDVNSRRSRYIEKVFNKMYDKYYSLTDSLENIDMTKDKKVIVTNLVEEYKKTLEMLVDYQTNTNDPISVQYQTLLEFRVLFIHLNNKLYTLKELIKEDE